MKKLLRKTVNDGFLRRIIEYMKKFYNVSVVGATGLIGGKFLKLLEKRKFPSGELKLFASPKSTGKKIYACGKFTEVCALNENSFEGTDIAFFFAVKDVSRIYAPAAEAAGAVVIDNSSAFRRCEDIPLVIPEINADKINLNKRRIIANPNCSTVQAILPLKYVARTHGIKRLIFSTYQAASGSGKKGVRDLLLSRQGFSPSYYPLSLAETCLCKIGETLPDGYTDEEEKMRFETNKILGISAKISATCIRVPIENCHAVSVEAELEKTIDIDEISREIALVEGVKICEYPSSVAADGNNNVLVGRLRKSTAFSNGICFTAFADNTLKGAALNAIQIAETLIESNKIQPEI